MMESLLHVVFAVLRPDRRIIYFLGGLSRGYELQDVRPARQQAHGALVWLSHGYIPVCVLVNCGCNNLLNTCKTNVSHFLVVRSPGQFPFVSHFGKTCFQRVSCVPSTVRKSGSTPRHRPDGSFHVFNAPVPSTTSVSPFF